MDEPAVPRRYDLGISSIPPVDESDDASCDGNQLPGEDEPREQEPREQESHEEEFET